MDPFCDKVLILGTFIYFAGPRFSVEAWVEGEKLLTMATGIYPWMVVVIIARELLVTSIRGILESMGHTTGAKWAGKMKMILQSFILPLILLLVVNFNPEKYAGGPFTTTQVYTLTSTRLQINLAQALDPDKFSTSRLLI